MDNGLAAKALRTNLVNIAKKVSAGRTLNSSERAMLQTAAATDGGEVAGELAANASQLASALGVHRMTVYRWLKQPGNPGHRDRGDFNVAEWRTWAETHGKRLWDSGVESAKSRTIELQNEKTEYQLQQLRDKFVPKSALRRVWTQFVDKAKAKSVRGLTDLVHSVRSAPDSVAANEIVRTAMIDIWKELSSGGWYQKSGAGGRNKTKPAKGISKRKKS